MVQSEVVVNTVICGSRKGAGDLMVETRTEKLSIRSKNQGILTACSVCLTYKLEGFRTFRKSSAKCHEFEGETSLSA